MKHKLSHSNMQSYENTIFEMIKEKCVSIDLRPADTLFIISDKEVVNHFFYSAVSTRYY